MSSTTAIPVVISSMAFYHLSTTGLFSTLTSSFFTLTTPEQISLLSLLFALVFFAVSLSTFLGPPTPAPSKPKPKLNFPPLPEDKSDREKFLLIYSHLRDHITTHITTIHTMPPPAVTWIKDMMDYNVPGGKLNRGLTVVAVHRTLTRYTKQRELTEYELARASVLGWAIEFLQAFFLVADDVMDDSETRRGQPCWYKQKKVQKVAINDSFLLENFVFLLIQSHFGMESYYMKIVNLFLETIQQTELGQLLDLTTQPQDAPIDLKFFTLERYELIVKYKTAFYSFYLPVALGMITSGIEDEQAFELAKKICCQMGEYFQIQDDYLDCFGDPETIGKIGTDIQDNKCSWLVVQALDRASSSQRKILEENYGKWDDAKVSKVKALYKELNLSKFFEEYEEESYKKIQAELDKVTSMPRDVFELLLKKIYKRKH